MRWSQSLIPTMKETPEGAEIPSHVLMLRAGLIGQVIAGAYAYLPLGLRALKKAERIVREEMDRAGAVEMLMPALTPISLWERSGRVHSFGDVLIQFKVKRQNRQVHLALGPTHEEVITEILARHVSSYRQLPVTVYQIQTKFRNEERPRFGVLRTSEFLMKDAYSFDATVEGLKQNYQRMYDAYCRIFSRAGLDYLAVEAESGPIGGDASHEFMVLAEHGEDLVVFCAGCRYAANVERAEIGPVVRAASISQAQPLTKVPTPGAKTIAEVSKHLSCKPQEMLKTLIYLADEKPLAVLVRGDHDVNEAKLRRAVGAKVVALADPKITEQVTGAPVGFAGPVGLKIPLWADRDAAAVANAVVGGNQQDVHYKGANAGRDFELVANQVTDLRNAVEHDPCPRCGKPVAIRHAIEVGHVFQVGTRYSESLDAMYLDAQEKQHPIIMGCYGIGVNRIIAALIETRHDQDGIVWPMSVAPYEVVVTPLNADQEDVVRTAEQLHDTLTEAGIDVLLDDRDQRAGVKFKDADLIGIPLRVVVGARGLKEGKLEIKWRWEAQPKQIDLASAAATITGLVNDARQQQPGARAPGN